MVRTQVQITEVQMRTLRRLAADRGVSVAALIREGVELLVRAAERPDDKRQRERALAVAGRFRSGRADLAAEHDRYLEDAYAE